MPAMKKPRRGRAQSLETLSALCQRRQRRASPHMHHNKRVPHLPRRTTGNTSVRRPFFSSFFFEEGRALCDTRSSFYRAFVERASLLPPFPSGVSFEWSALCARFNCHDVPCRALCLIESKTLWRPFEGVASVWRWRLARGWLRAARGLLFAKSGVWRTRVCTSCSKMRPMWLAKEVRWWELGLGRGVVCAWWSECLVGGDGHALILVLLGGAIGCVG